MQPLSIAMSVFTICGTILLGISVLPQLFLTLKHKKTSKLSFNLYLFLGIGTTFMLVYGIGLLVIPSGVNNLSHLEWLWSYRIPGIAIVICEVICSSSSFIIAFIKLYNKHQAKHLKLSEEEYENIQKVKD